MKDPVQDQENSTTESDSKSSEDISNEDSNSDKKII